MAIDEREFGEMVATVRSIHSKLDDHISETREWYKDQDDRLRKLEDDFSQSTGWRNAWGGLFGFVAGAIAGYIGRRFG